MTYNVWFTFLCALICSVTNSASLFHDHVPCSPVGHCKCEFPNGLGIDLSLLSSTNFSIPAGPGFTLLYFPCRDVPVPSVSNLTSLNECLTGVSLCLEHIDAKEVKFYNLGSSFSGSFLWERITDQPELIFTYNDKSTNIVLNCDFESKIPTLVQMKSSDPSNAYTFKLTTELACLSTVEEEGHSVFSTMLIVIIIIFLMYFLGGFLVLKFIRGATGWEAVPNIEFWQSVGTSIKEMFSYLANGCQRPETYDTI